MIKYWLDSEERLWIFQEVDEGKVIIASDLGVLPLSTVETFHGPLKPLYAEEDMLGSSSAADTDSAEIDGIPLADLYAALVMLDCPWRRRTGICASGCREEPACETGEPEGGWGAEVRRIVGVQMPDDVTLNMLAQRFYEASGIRILMTDKPLVVNGLQAVFQALANE